VALALALAIFAGCAGPTATPSSTALPRTAWQGVLAQIGPRGEVSKEMALEAFSLAVAPLPGATTPAGARPAATELLDGTPAIYWLERVWDQLTGEQQQAALDALMRLDAFRAEPSGGSPFVLAAAVAQAVASPTESTRACAHGDIYGSEFVPDEVAPVWDEFNDDANRVAARAHVDLPTLLTVCLVPLSETGGAGLLTRAYTWDMRPAQGSPAECAVFVDRDAAKAAQSDSPGVFTYVLTVAAIECLIGMVQSPPWVQLGLTAWAGSSVAVEKRGGLDGHFAGSWQAYLTDPAKPLFARAYDAIGYFSQLSTTEDVWAVLSTTLPVAGSEDAFIASGGTNDDFKAIWASGFFRDAAGGPPWNISGPEVTSDTAAPASLAVANGQKESVSADPVSAQIRQVGTTADITTIRGSEVRIFDGTYDHVMSGSVEREAAGLYCTREGDNPTCVCPEGSLRFGEQPPLKLANSFHLALTGLLAGGTASIEGESLADYCGAQSSASPSLTPPPGHEKPKPKGEPDPCAAGCGESVGDPHMTTIDGGSYDFMAAGEYVLLRSAEGKFEIQARQKPVSDDASSDSALAWLVNGHRVSMYEAPGPVGTGFTLHVDGDVVPPFQTVDLGAGAQIAAMGFGIEVAWPDGTLAWAFPTGDEGMGINLTIAPAPALRPSLSGLLAPIGPGSALPALADGTTLPTSTDHDTRYAQLHEQLGPSWHVTDQTSLFDYGAGETTASFDVTGFPAPEAPLNIDEAQLGATVEEVTAAGETCAAIAANDQEQVRCLFDVLITDNPQWAAFYQRLLEFLDKGPDTLQGNAPPPTGMVTVTDVSSLGGLSLTPGGHLAASVTHVDNNSELLTIDSSTGEIEARRAISGTGSVGLAAGSLWATSGSFESCSIDRLNPSTLEPQATVSVPCSPFGALLLTTEDAAWANDGTSLRRVDPSTSALGSPIALPVADGILLASRSAVFNSSNDDPSHWYRLTTADAGFVDMGELTSVIAPAGAALWADQFDGAKRYSTPNAGPDLSIDIDGVLVTADDNAIYAARSESTSSQSELWRYPIDGSAATLAAANDVEVPAAFGNTILRYEDARMVSDGTNLVAVWQTLGALDQPGTMYVQTIANQ
jgi:hypothetical protein